MGARVLLVLSGVPHLQQPQRQFYTFFKKRPRWLSLSRACNFTTRSTLLPPDVPRLAETARITLTPNEVEEFTPKIRQVIDWFGQLQEVDLQSFEPTLRADTGGDNLRNDLPETFENRFDIHCQFWKKTIDHALKATLAIDVQQRRDGLCRIAEQTILEDDEAAGTELQGVLGDLGVSRHKRVNNKSLKVYKSQAKRKMADIGSSSTTVLPVLDTSVDTDVAIPKVPKEPAVAIVKPSLDADVLALENSLRSLVVSDASEVKSIVEIELRSVSHVLKGLALGIEDGSELLQKRIVVLEQRLASKLEKEMLKWNSEVVNLKVSFQVIMDKLERESTQNINEVSVACDNLVQRLHEDGYSDFDIMAIMQRLPINIVGTDEEGDEVLLAGLHLERERNLSPISALVIAHTKAQVREYKALSEVNWRSLCDAELGWAKAKIEKDGVVRKDRSRYIKIQPFLPGGIRENTLEVTKDLMMLTIYLEAKIDSERGLKESYLRVLEERGICPDPDIIERMATKARNLHSLKAKDALARVGVSMIYL
ncbi:hypothetical protein GIB67_042843 [Kingdonia uniflora]|uniref:Uncharacterized protein n=1 Tax=Kingdonia uniflora TaxID=39325 RepID=A0A7J7NSY8_9MAGN|nr:hypothetical protein GIB67_042843 [Kingdonia uniflora]